MDVSNGFCDRVHARRGALTVAGAIAVALTIGAPALATNYDWTGGNYFPSFPGTINASDTLTITASSGTPVFNGNNTFTNNGTVYQTGVNVDIQQTNTAVANGGVWDETDSVTGGIYSSTGGGSFTNAGTIETTGGGNLVFNNTAGTFTFTDNGGLINAQNGQIKFSGPNVNFNGTTFEGASGVNLTAGANFSGTVTSWNNALQLASGTFNSTGTTLGAGSSVIWSGGALSGVWNIGGGSNVTLNVETGVSKSLVGATVTNNGTINWGPSQSVNSLAFGGGSTLTNNGVIDATVTSNLGAGTASNPGGSIINNGLIEKTGGSGTTVIGSSSVSFTNTATGVIESLSGTIQLPSHFTNSGTIGGTATIAVPGGLTNNGTIAPGTLSQTGAPLSVGTLQLAGSLTQGSTGVLEIGATGSSFSELNVTGSVTAGGTMDVLCLSSCSVAPGTYQVLSSTAGITGMFSLVDSGFAGENLALVQNGNVLDLTVTSAVPLPATQWLMLSGFGLIGLLVSRRRVHA